MKKILFTFLTVLLASLAAQAATDYGFEVAGVTVTSANCNNIVSNYLTSGTVYYVPSSNTLYMDNVTIFMTGDYNRVINNLENEGLKVQFSGTCNLYARDAAVVRIRRPRCLPRRQALSSISPVSTRTVSGWQQAIVSILLLRVPEHSISRPTIIRLSRMRTMPRATILIYGTKCILIM